MFIQKHYQNLAIGAIAPIFWGTTYAVVNLSLQEATPIWIAVLRTLPAGLLLLMFKPSKLPISLIKMLLLAFFNISCFSVLLFIAAYRLPGSVAGTLAALFPLFLMLLAWIVYGQKPQKIVVLLSSIGCVGVGLLLNPFHSGVVLDALGVVASFLAIALFAMCTLWMQHWQVKDRYALTAWQLLFGGAMLIPVAMVFESTLPTVNVSMTGGLLWLILLNTALSYLAFIYATNRLETSEIGMLALLNPIVAVLTGVWLVHEVLQISQYLGIGMILLALCGVVQQKWLASGWQWLQHHFIRQP